MRCQLDSPATNTGNFSRSALARSPFMALYPESDILGKGPLFGFIHSLGWLSNNLSATVFLKHSLRRFYVSPLGSLITARPSPAPQHTMPQRHAAGASGACGCCGPQTGLLPRCSAHAAPDRYTLFEVWSPPSHRLRVGRASAWRSSAIRSAPGASRVNSRSMPLGSLIYTERQ
jgi:hypothetical protein